MVGYGDNVRPRTSAVRRRSAVISLRSPRWEIMSEAARASQIIAASVRAFPFASALQLAERRLGGTRFAVRPSN